MTTPAWIGLGSNLGDRRAILGAALDDLGQVPGVAVRAVSSSHETRPVGGPPGQGPFLNAAARLETSLDPHQLLAVLQRVEAGAGRVRAIRWGERTLDLDILVYGTTFLDVDDLKLPHPRLPLRRFALAPLAEIAPEVVDPMTGRTIADLLANLDRRPRLVALEGPPGPGTDRISRRLVETLGLGRSGREVTPDSWEVAPSSLGPRTNAAIPGPTFVVILPGAGEAGRKPGARRIPELRPESDDPAAIVAEVVATCRGIDGVR